MIIQSRGFIFFMGMIVFFISDNGIFFKRSGVYVSFGWLEWFWIGFGWFYFFLLYLFIFFDGCWFFIAFYGLTGVGFIVLCRLFYCFSSMNFPFNSCSIFHWCWSVFFLVLLCVLVLFLVRIRICVFSIFFGVVDVDCSCYLVVCFCFSSYFNFPEVSGFR